MTFAKRLSPYKLIAMVLTCVLLVPAQAADLGNPESGQRFAQIHCAACHSIVRDGNSSAVDAATPFQTIANTPGMTRTALFVFFRSPHRNMPNLVVKGDDLDNIIAYILSLKSATQ